MERFKLAIGIHNHQPIGNFDSVFDEAHNNSYMPFLKIFEQFDKLKLSLHQSGILWKWQEKTYPQYFDMIQQLIYDDRLELMTGGFFEPILPSIPDRDKLGQIEMLSRYLEGRFGSDPTGLWVTERVWEPHLPKILNSAGVQYVPLDDTHFLYSGFELNQLKGVFVTEEEGATVRLLPIQKRLRYLIPFGTVDEVIDELKTQADINPGGLAVYADDGEKFGVWPKTYEHCYQDGWLEKLFKALSVNSDWLEVITLAEAARTRPVGRAYLPSASYAEMLHWALPSTAFVEYEELEEWLKKNNKTEQYGRFVRGGHWRGFMAKYDETNMMHKRMLMVSDMVDQFAGEYPEKRETIDKARQNLYAAQCNCAYWHGVFGGLYLPHLRKAIYENLIRAEKFLIPSLDKVDERVFDYDNDGHDEIVVTTNKYTSIIKPSSGGMLVELDNREAAINLTDILRRRKEGYHRKLEKAQLDTEEVPANENTASIHDLVLTKEEGLDKILADDWHAKHCFIDHFLPDDINIDKFADGQCGDNGDFVLEPWIYDRGGKGKAPGMIKLIRNGKLWLPDNVVPLEIRKTFFFGKDSEVITVNYVLTSGEDLNGLRFAVENNFNLLAGHADDRFVLYDNNPDSREYLDAVVGKKNCTSVQMHDQWLNLAIVLMLDHTAEIWQTPIFTVSLSEGGFEKVYQGTSLLTIFELNIKKNIPLELSLMLFSGRPENMPPRMAR
jgi:alpha-amylase